LYQATHGLSGPCLHRCDSTYTHRFNIYIWMHFGPIPVDASHSRSQPCTCGSQVDGTRYITAMNLQVYICSGNMKYKIPGCWDLGNSSRLVGDHTRLGNAEQEIVKKNHGSACTQIEHISCSPRYVLLSSPRSAMR
jgi:hypothetical protein